MLESTAVNMSRQMKYKLGNKKLRKSNTLKNLDIGDKPMSKLQQRGQMHFKKFSQKQNLDVDKKDQDEYLKQGKTWKQ